MRPRKRRHEHGKSLHVMERTQSKEQQTVDGEQHNFRLSMRLCYDAMKNLLFYTHSVSLYRAKTDSHC